MVGGYRAGANIAAIEQEQQARQQAMQLAAMKQQQEMMLQQQKQAAFDRLNAPDVTPNDYRNAALLGNKEQSEVIMKMMAQNDEATNRATISKLAPTVFALHANKPERAISALEQQLQAYQDNPAAQQQIQSQIDAIKTDPESAKLELTGVLSLVPGGEKILENVLSLTKENRAQSEEKRAAELHATEVSKGKSEAEIKQAEAEFARKNQIAKLQQQAASLGLTKAQTNQAIAQTRNLTEQGQMMALDFKAALNGLPLPSKGGGTKPASAATEDERKAAGWLAQADNSYKNMLSAMYTKEGKATGAEKPGFLETVTPLGFGAGAVRSTERQKFVQASESLGEAILRAATGAGVNKDEAAQKARELTPVFTDDEETRKQKLDAIPMYLKSLHTRAGRAAPENYEIPQPPKSAQAQQPVIYARNPQTGQRIMSNDGGKTWAQAR